MIIQPTDEQRQHCEDQGYVVIRDLIDQSLIQSAAAAFERILVRAGKFGDQFRWVWEEARLPSFRTIC